MPTISYIDPFFHEVQYSPTDKAAIDRHARTAARLITPHLLVLQLLFSRLQAARYRKPGLMLLFQRLALSSARAHKSMWYGRLLSCWFQVLTEICVVHIL